MKNNAWRPLPPDLDESSDVTMLFEVPHFFSILLLCAGAAVAVDVAGRLTLSSARADVTVHNANMQAVSSAISFFFMFNPPHA